MPRGKCYQHTKEETARLAWVTVGWSDRKGVTEKRHLPGELTAVLVKGTADPKPLEAGKHGAWFVKCQGCV